MRLLTLLLLVVSLIAIVGKAASMADAYSAQQSARIAQIEAAVEGKERAHARSCEEMPFLPRCHAR